MVHDDLELDPFRIQLKVGGGHGGHNGLKSLNAHVGGPRVRARARGRGRPPPQMDPADYVLGRFSKADDAALEESVERATEATRLCGRAGRREGDEPGEPPRERGGVAALLQRSARRHGAGWRRRRRLLAAGEPPLSDPRGATWRRREKLVREYETIYLLKAETPDDQVEDIKERLRGVVPREGGKVIRFTNQGKKKTAFPVGKNPKALYMHCLYVGRPGLVQELERNLKMIDVVRSSSR